MSFDKYFETAQNTMPEFTDLPQVHKIAAITTLTPDALPELDRMIKENPGVVDEQTKDGCNLFRFICLYIGSFSSLECLQLLLKHGADYNKHYDCDGNSLHVASRYTVDSCLYVTVKFLVEIGCDINCCTINGSVLYQLILRNTEESLKTAQYLIELGADLELVDVTEKTCLMAISQHTRKNDMTYPILKTLIRFSDVSKISFYRKTAYQYYENNPVLHDMLTESEVNMLKGEYTGKLTKSAANR